MNIQHHFKSVILATALTLSAGVIQTAVAYTNNQSYKIINVANWDALNIRSGAGTEYRVINEIPANASGITLIGDEREVNGSTWVKILWNGQKGWVNKRYLTIAEASVTPASNINYAQNNTQITATPHSHPANRCTRSISHTHAGPAGHTHKYSCKRGNGRQQAQNQPNTTKANYYNPTPVATYTPPARPRNTDIYGNYRRVVMTNNNMGSHTHPANACTRSITHTHAGAKPGHKHRYSCQGKGRQQRVVRRTTYYGSYGSNLQHTHGKSQCVSAISHSHKGGDRIHRHQCTPSSHRSNASNMHTHRANALTRATTHSHPYQDRNHTHRYGRR